MPLDGADAQALEGALTITERERDEALDRMEVMAREHDETRGYRQHAEQQRDAEIDRWQTRIADVIRAAGLEPYASDNESGDPLDVSAEQVRHALRVDSVGTCTRCGYHGPGPRHECAAVAPSLAQPCGEGRVDIQTENDRDAVLFAVLRAIGESDWTPNDVREAGATRTFAHIAEIAGTLRLRIAALELIRLERARRRG